VTTAASQSQRASEKNAAVAAEHERESFFLEKSANLIRQLSRVFGDPWTIAKSSRSI
jgi:hypothetical protein